MENYNARQCARIDVAYASLDSIHQNAALLSVEDVTNISWTHYQSNDALRNGTAKAKAVCSRALSSVPARIRCLTWSQSQHYSIYIPFIQQALDTQGLHRFTGRA